MQPVSINCWRKGASQQPCPASEDGAGNILDAPFGVAVDSSGNIYVTGALSSNAFKNQFCGDGLPDAGEECDDGNNQGGDGCSANCLIEIEVAEIPAVPEAGLILLATVLLGTGFLALRSRLRIIEGNEWGG